MVRRGYTLIELCVVIVIIAAISAIVVPNLSRARDAQTRRDFEAQLYRFASDARESAITQHKTLALAMSDREFTIVEEDPNGGEDQQRRSLQMPDGLNTGSMAAEGEDATSSDWKLRFYPDGSSDGGGVELSDNGRVRSLQIKADGSMRFLEGSLEDTGTQKWSAGEIEKRAE